MSLNYRSQGYKKKVEVYYRQNIWDLIAKNQLYLLKPKIKAIDMKNLEVCANSVQSVIEAKKGGAIRVELCDNLADGGTTPPLSWIEVSANIPDIQTFVIIRPRGGDFLYTEIEFETMKRDIICCGEAKCDGVVIGILTDEGKVDMERNKELVSLAKKYSMSVTFHRAFDRVDNLLEALEDVIELGCDRILTSGGEKTALAGKAMIAQLISKSDGRIIIMPGSGITEDNVSSLVSDLAITEFHGTFRHSMKGEMKYIRDNIDTFENEYTYMVTSAEKVRKAIKNANNI